MPLELQQSIEADFEFDSRHNFCSTYQSHSVLSIDSKDVRVHTQCFARQPWCYNTTLSRRSYVTHLEEISHWRRYVLGSFSKTRGADLSFSFIDCS